MLIFVCTCLAARKTPSFTVGKPAVLMSSDFMQRSGFGSRPDASLYAIKRRSGYQFFVQNGPDQSLGTSKQSVLSDGGSGRLEVTKYEAAVTIENYPCPPGFSSKWGCQREAVPVNALWLNTCTDSPSQRWNFSVHSSWTNVQSKLGNVCMVGRAAKIGSFGISCSALPIAFGKVQKKGNCGELPHNSERTNASCLNSAWSFKPNGTIAFGIPGRSGNLDQCLQLGADNISVIVDECRGAQREIWVLGADGTIESALGGCIESSLNPIVNYTNAFGGQGLAHSKFWVSNVYNADVDGILLFFHIEMTTNMDPNKPEGDADPFFRFGLAHSADEGASFQWCGYVVEPAISFEHSMFGSRYHLNATSGAPNMGLTNYIEKDGYFMIYYTDTHELNCTTPTTCTVADAGNQTGSGGGGHPDQGVAVARAKIADVVAAAKDHRVANFKKYFEGSWGEPALASGYNCSGGRFTPLNLPVQGYLHGDAAYIPKLRQWCIVTASGGKGAQDGKDWMRKILIAFSADGLRWSPWQTVWSDELDGATSGATSRGTHRTFNGDVKYPSLMALEGDDNEVLAGKAFAVVFQYRGPGTAKPWGEMRYVNVTLAAR